MLDEREVERYNEWKAKKLLGQQDLSVDAYNLELEATALAYDRGVRTMGRGMRTAEVQAELDANPFRVPGGIAEPPAVTTPRKIAAPVEPIDPEEAEMDERAPSAEDDYSDTL